MSTVTPRQASRERPGSERCKSEAWEIVHVKGTQVKDAHLVCTSYARLAYVPVHVCLHVKRNSEENPSNRTFRRKTTHICPPLGKPASGVGWIRRFVFQLWWRGRPFRSHPNTLAEPREFRAGSLRDRLVSAHQAMLGPRFRRHSTVGSRVDIEDQHYRANLNPRAVLSTLAVIEARFDVPVVFAAPPEEAAELVETWVWWMAREIACSANDLLRGCESQVDELPELRTAGAAQE